MRFSIATVLAFAASALAQTTGFDAITKPIKDEAVPAGSTYEIVWSPDATHPGTIKIGLLGGASQGTLDVIDTIASKTSPVRSAAESLPLLTTFSTNSRR